jgi:phosphonate transport system ATP-binding protein
VLGYLKEISQRLGISVICNLHQIDFAREYAQRIIGLARGELVFDGAPDELTPEVIERIYGQHKGADLG